MSRPRVRLVIVAGGRQHPSDASYIDLKNPFDGANGCPVRWRRSDGCWVPSGWSRRVLSVIRPCLVDLVDLVDLVVLELDFVDVTKIARMLEQAVERQRAAVVDVDDTP